MNTMNLENALMKLDRVDPETGYDPVSGYCGSDILDYIRSAPQELEMQAAAALRARGWQEA